jgi:hypothetical protein
MSSFWARPTGTARARIPEPDSRSEPAPFAPGSQPETQPETQPEDESSAFVWPPPDEELAAWIEPLDVGLDAGPEAEVWAAADVEPTLDDETEAFVAATVEASRSRPVSRAWGPAWALLATAGAALVGAGVAWLTPPVPETPPQVPTVSSSSVRSSPEAPSPLPKPALADPPAAPIRSAPIVRHPLDPATRPEPRVAASPRLEPAADTPRDAPDRPSIELPSPPTLTGELVEHLPVAPAAPAFVAESPAPSPPSESASAALGRQERIAIEQLLAQYRHAYDARDAVAASAIWPSVDVPALERAFAGIKSQQVLFDRCDLKVAPDRATAVCPGSLTFVRRVGTASAEVRRLAWTFAFERASQGWQIARVAAR